MISQQDSSRYPSTTAAAGACAAPADIRAASRLVSTSPTPPGVTGTCRTTCTARYALPRVTMPSDRCTARATATRQIRSVSQFTVASATAPYQYRRGTARASRSSPASQVRIRPRGTGTGVATVRAGRRVASSGSATIAASPSATAATSSGQRPAPAKRGSTSPSAPTAYSAKRPAVEATPDRTVTVVATARLAPRARNSRKANPAETAEPAGTA
ncbi:MAG TPA: hypothetical protein VJT31_03145 [Rugosimonospora sp.]|nr:hypothetical protein [Rugosimonospora sp.]